MNGRALPRLAAVTAVLALTVLGALVAPGRARANGVPIRIPLAYVPGLSNAGPQDARGEAEISFSEALVRLDARGLTPLAGEQYVIWLAKSGTNRAVAVGPLTVGPDGTAGYTGKLAGLDSYDYDLVILTLEPQPDTHPTPSEKRSIGGFFQPIKRTEQAAPGIASDTMPATLPNTGEPAPAAPRAGNRISGVMLMVGGGMVLFLTMRRWRVRRRSDGQ